MKDAIYIIDKQLWASDRRRFANCFLDFFFGYFTLFISGLVVVIVGNIFNLDVFSIWENIVFNYMYSVLFFFIMFNYLLLEYFFGRSFGKLMTGTVVVNKNGLKPTFGAILIRTLCRLIPFDALSFLGKSGRIWHDALSATYVVDKNALDRDIKLHDLSLIGVLEVD
ncbi:RDD family protein [[Flexibacter] sp. ATCC 35103]|uniref:RDD family protein n=1 Tax=[Flexibacter] sp. ATCC 35103 TaxID=1937528 RepID=UPI0009D03D59|nr:RDD family protein [[Flexibacter] sp. ATCC 35103]OMQ10950.1 hypothetical protein BXU01_11465 [[Flexibacter] sp. ATCC 35103]